MSDRPDRPDQPRRRPSKPSGSGKSSGGGKSRSSSSSASRRDRSSASMSRGPRPIVAGSDRSGEVSGANASGVGARRRERQKQKDKNKPIIIGAVIFVVLAICVVFIGFTYNSLTSGGNDNSKPNVGTQTGENGTEGTGPNEFTWDYKDPYAEFEQWTEKEVRGKTLKKFMSLKQVEALIGSSNSHEKTQDGSEATKHIYGTGSLTGNRVNGWILYFNKFGELVWAQDHRKAAPPATHRHR